MRKTLIHISHLRGLPSHLRNIVVDVSSHGLYRDRSLASHVQWWPNNRRSDASSHPNKARAQLYHFHVVFEAF